jgi:hypothetical protein
MRFFEFYLRVMFISSYQLWGRGRGSLKVENFKDYLSRLCLFILPARIVLFLKESCDLASLLKDPSVRCKLLVPACAHLGLVDLPLLDLWVTRAASRPASGGSWAWRRRRLRACA